VAPAEYQAACAGELLLDGIAASVTAKTSAGILMYRRRAGGLEVFLVHPGGPYWKNKDLGAWMIPKGEIAEGEDPFEVAVREFEEETGTPPKGPFAPLTAIKQKGGKVVAAWACEGDLDAGAVESNTFSMEWPPGSGKTAEFPEVDRAAWFSLEEAKDKLLPSQLPLLEELETMLENSNE
jgi:predicted NUDIX family NTP pyrophosphohydrolase